MKFGSIFNTETASIKPNCALNEEENEESINIDIEDFIRELDHKENETNGENEKNGEISKNREIPKNCEILKNHEISENRENAQIRDFEKKREIEKKAEEIEVSKDSEEEKKARRLNYMVNMHLAEETLITKCLKQQQK